MLEYPTKDGHWTWEQLELLAKSLGYHQKIISENVPEKKYKTFITLENLKFLLEGDKLYPLLHKTYNHQNGTYNIKVIQKSIELLMQRYISFSILHQARVSFQTYEHTDHAGLEDKFLLRAMQFCGKTMAPLKIKQILRHMGRLVQDRLMFYEFLELIASGDNITSVKKELPTKKVVDGKTDELNLFALCDFEDELSTEEQRYYRFLDQKYEDSRRIIAVEESNDKNMLLNKSKNIQWAIPPQANQSIRKEMIKSNNVQSQKLKSHLDSSSAEVKRRGCDVPCICEAERVVSSLTKSENTSTSSIETNKQPSQPTSCVKFRMMAPIVTDEDMRETVRKIEGLQWDIATHSHLRKKRIEADTVGQR